MLKSRAAESWLFRFKLISCKKFGKQVDHESRSQVCHLAWCWSSATVYSFRFFLEICKVYRGKRTFLAPLGTRHEVNSNFFLQIVWIFFKTSFSFFWKLSKYFLCYAELFCAFMQLFFLFSSSGFPLKGRWKEWSPWIKRSIFFLFVLLTSGILNILIKRGIPAPLSSKTFPCFYSKQLF